MSDDKVLAPTLAIQPEFEKIFKQMGLWETFCRMFIESFLCIHRNSGLIISYAYQLFSSIYFILSFTIVLKLNIGLCVR